MDKDLIFSRVSEILQETFEIDAADITLEANLYEELDLDSIDAIDLVVKIQDITGRKVKPEDFKAARTIGDVVDIIFATTL
ncbi:MAG: acyl carrier protein [Spongiibacteraceae bacterium]